MTLNIIIANNSIDFLPIFFSCLKDATEMRRGFISFKRVRKDKTTIHNTLTI